jgi:hypothetical protein
MRHRARSALADVKGRRLTAAVGTDGSRQRHPLRGGVAIVATVAFLLILATRLVPHPVGPARTFDKYEGKATTTAKGVLSNVETVRLAAQAASRGRAFGPYLSVVISDAEDSISGLQGTFAAIQPPDDRGDSLAQDLDSVLSDALEHVREVRVAVRRGELGELAETASPLAEDIDKLRRFQEQHG